MVAEIAPSPPCACVCVRVCVCVCVCARRGTPGNDLRQLLERRTLGMIGEAADTVHKFSFQLLLPTE